MVYDRCQVWVVGMYLFAAEVHLVPVANRVECVGVKREVAQKTWVQKKDLIKVDVVQLP